MFGIATRQRFLLAGVVTATSSSSCCSNSTTSSASIVKRINNNSTSIGNVNHPPNSLHHNNGTCSFLTLFPVLATSKRFQSVPGAASYKCSACGKAFRMPNALTHHITTKHGGDAQSIPLDAAGKPITGGAAASTPSSPATPPSSPQQQQQQQQPQPANAASPSSAAAAPTPPTTSSSSSIPVPDPTGVQQQQQQQQISEEEFSKKAFVCTICQKPFRIEAALIHHYKAKHGIEQAGGGPEIPAAPETASSSSSSSSTTTIPDSAANANEQTLSVSDVINQQQQVAAATTVAAQQQQQQQTSQQYQFHQTPSPPTAPTAPATAASEAVTSPLPPQYHLDVAPNAPEEREIAVHHSCVNSITLMGAAQDATTGYVFEDRVLQFVVTTMFDSPAPGEPDRDFHTVRVYLKDGVEGSTSGSGGDLAKNDQTLVDNYFGKEIAEVLLSAKKDSSTGNVKKVLVSGRLRMVPQYEPTTGRYYHFPVVQVQQGSGYVRCVE